MHYLGRTLSLAPRLSGILQGSGNQGRSDHAPGPMLHTWPGCGASLQALDPMLSSVRLRGRDGWIRFPQLVSESWPSPTVIRATVGCTAARCRRRGRAWIGFSGARGGVARWFRLKMASSLRTAGASGRAHHGMTDVALRVGLTGPNRTRRELHSTWSIFPSSFTLLARPESPRPLSSAK